MLEAREKGWIMETNDRIKNTLRPEIKFFKIKKHYRPISVYVIHSYITWLP